MDPPVRYVIDNDVYNRLNTSNTELWMFPCLPASPPRLSGVRYSHRVGLSIGRSDRFGPRLVGTAHIACIRCRGFGSRSFVVLRRRRVRLQAWPPSRRAWPCRDWQRWAAFDGSSRRYDMYLVFSPRRPGRTATLIGLVGLEVCCARAELAAAQRSQRPIPRQRVSPWRTRRSNRPNTMSARPFPEWSRPGAYI